MLIHIISLIEKFLLPFRFHNLHLYDLEHVPLFKNDGTPDYKIRVDEGKDKFTIYPCMTEKRIKRRDFTALQVMKLSEKKMKKEESKKEKLDLKQALKQQTDFLNGETKK